jgi:hypothetical protein
LPVKALILSSLSSFLTWRLTSDHPPPVQNIFLSPLSPRSPPHLA